MPISATRLERNVQISRERVARRGHKLLKDKSDEMFRNLTEMKKKRDVLRVAVSDDIGRILKEFFRSRVYMSPVEIENALGAIGAKYELTAGTKNIMGLLVPNMEIKSDKTPEWHFNTTHVSFDRAVKILETVIVRLVHLAALEKTCEMLDAEIARLRRRVNALEYAVIPKIHANIKDITLRLSENERGNTARIMKIKQKQK
jgi:V/A-type H+-transporting ATPase subunit D